jgi:hypothetical protein
VEILLGFALVTCARIAVVGYGIMLASAQLVAATATGVTILVVMDVMPALVVVVVCAQLVAQLVVRVCTALFVQVIGVLIMYATGLEVLVLALEGFLLVVVLVATVTAVVSKLVLL